MTKRNAIHTQQRFYCSVRFSKHLRTSASPQNRKPNGQTQLQPRARKGIFTKGLQLNSSNCIKTEAATTCSAEAVISFLYQSCVSTSFHVGQSPRTTCSAMLGAASPSVFTDSQPSAQAPAPATRSTIPSPALDFNAFREPGAAVVAVEVPLTSSTRRVFVPPSSAHKDSFQALADKHLHSRAPEAASTQ